MSVGGLLVGLFILLVAVAWIGSPLFGRRASTKSDATLLLKQRERLLMVYERVVNNIRDLDEDQATGKMQADDYETEREEWVQRGIQVLKAMDSLEAQHEIPVSLPADATDDDIDRQIEEAIAAYHTKANEPS